MLKARCRRLITAVAAGALTMTGAAGAVAAEERPGAGQLAGGGQSADAGDGLSPLCMLRPQDCMYPPDDNRNGDGDRRPSPDPDTGGMNPLCLLRPQDCWPPPGQDGRDGRTGG